MININKKAVTIVEISIALVILVIILVALMNLFSVGLKASTKGLAHQDNIQVASILMTQIEYDLLKAVKIESPIYNSRASEAQWRMCDEKSDTGYVLVDYTLEGDEIARKVTLPNNKIEKSFFGKGHKIDISFIHLAVDSKTKNYDNSSFLKYNYAMWVELTVASKYDKKLGVKGKIGENEVTLKKLVFLKNI